MSAIVAAVRREPVLVAGLVQALLGAAAAWGLPLTDTQTAAVLAVTGAVLALVARSAVSPVAPEDQPNG